LHNLELLFPLRSRKTPAMPGREKLAEFAGWSQKHITGDEKGQAQIFLDRVEVVKRTGPRARWRKTHL
jgi:hypothetical protein